MRENINLLISIDDDYLIHAMDLIYSLSLHNNFYINLYIVHDDSLSKETLDNLSNFLKDNNYGELKSYYFDSSNMNFPMYINYISIVTYFRLYAPFIIEEDIDRLLYLDCDIICNGSIHDLYNTDFEDNIIVACENLVKEDYSDLNEKYNENIGLPKDNKYVNGGVLLIDVKKYKKFTSIKKINKLIEEYSDKLEMQDQDVINKLFYKKIKLQNIIYNYQINCIKYGHEDWNMKLVHYSYKDKPWKDDYKYQIKAIPFYKMLKSRGDIVSLSGFILKHSCCTGCYIFDAILEEKI